MTKALKLLGMFADNRPRMGLTELAALSGLPKGTAHRLLIALEEEDLVLQDPESRKWGLGFGVMRLYHNFREQFSLFQIVTPWMQRLRDQFQETICLVVEDSGHAICVERVDPHHELRLHTAVGSREPLHAGAGRKVLLAFLPEERRDQIIASMQLEAFTPRTVTHAEQLRRDLSEIRQQGYAITAGEHNPGAVAVAAPLLGPNGRLVASMSVTGPAVRLTPEKIDLILPCLLDASRQISRQLGFRGGTASANGGGRNDRVEARTSA